MFQDKNGEKVVCAYTGVIPLAVNLLSSQNKLILMRSISTMMKMMTMNRGRMVSNKHPRRFCLYSQSDKSVCERGYANFLVLLAFTEVQLEQKSVPTAVFGGLKDD